jgi:hypothetical protein
VSTEADSAKAAARAAWWAARRGEVVMLASWMMESGLRACQAGKVPDEGA